MSVAPEMQKVFQYIDDHKEEYIELLKKFSAQPSVSAQNWGMREMAEMIRENLQKMGVPVELVETQGVPGNPIVYGELNYGKKYTATAYNHYDVQPPEPLEQWKTPPFTPTVIGDRIYGRGTSDNKGSLLSRHCAVDAYLKVYGKLPINMKFMVEGAEEVGSPNLESFIKENPEKVKTDCFMWEGGTRTVNGPVHVSFGVKGVTSFELRCYGANTDLHSASASIVPSPVWRLVQALATMKNDKDEITIDGFYDTIVPPSEEDMEFLKTLPFDEEGTKARLGIPAFINNLSGVELQKKNLFLPTLNIQGIQAGYTGQGGKTVLPSYAFCKLDTRTVMGQRPDKVMKQIREHLDRHGYGDIEVVHGHSTLPFRGSPENPLFKAVVKNIPDIYHQPAAVFPSTPGSTGVGFMYELTGTPAVCFGVMNEESNAHAPNENIFLDDYINGIKLSAAVIHDLGELG